MYIHVHVHIHLNADYKMGGGLLLKSNWCLGWPFLPATLHVASTMFGTCTCPLQELSSCCSSEVKVVDVSNTPSAAGQRYMCTCTVMKDMWE